MQLRLPPSSYASARYGATRANLDWRSPVLDLHCIYAVALARDHITMPVLCVALWPDNHIVATYPLSSSVPPRREEVPSRRTYELSSKGPRPRCTREPKCDISYPSSPELVQLSFYSLQSTIFPDRRREPAPTTNGAKSIARRGIAGAWTNEHIIRTGRFSPMKQLCLVVHMRALIDRHAAEHSPSCWTQQPQIYRDLCCLPIKGSLLYYIALAFALRIYYFRLCYSVIFLRLPLANLDAHSI